MKTKILAIIISGLLLTAFSAAYLPIDTSDPAITFFFVNNKVAGTVGAFEGEVKWDPERPEKSTLRGSVQVATLKTGNFIRNAHLRKGTYFNASAFPEMSFQSAAIKKQGSSFVVVGDLTIKGVKKSTVFEFRQQGNALVGKASINTHDFGIVINKKWEENAVNVTIQFPIK